VLGLKSFIAYVDEMDDIFEAQGLHHRAFAVDTQTYTSSSRPTTPAVGFVAVVYYAVATTRLLLCACCLPLRLLGDILDCVLCYRLLSSVYPLVFS